MVLAVFDLGTNMAADDWNAALEFIDSSPVISGKLLAQISKGQVTDLYQQSGQAVPFYSKLTLEFFKSAPVFDRSAGPFRSGLPSPMPLGYGCRPLGPSYNLPQGELRYC